MYVLKIMACGWRNKIYRSLLEKTGLMATQRVSKLEYLDMTLDYSDKGEVHIKMDDFVEQLLKEAPPDMQG